MASSEPPSQPQSGTKSNRPELPTPSGTTPARPRLTTTPSHLLPAPALFHGPNSHTHNASRTSLSRTSIDQYRNPATPIDPPPSRPQQLPRAQAPTKSFSGPRPSLIGQSAASAQGTQTRAAIAGKKEDDFRADAVWAEMQKTLADVEFSAMNSSHVFSSTHAKALEDLRSAQLGLAQAWAKSEADEMIDEEFGGGEVVGENRSARQGYSGSGNANGTSPSSAKDKDGKTHSRTGSTSSSAGKNLEEVTERDMRLARKRREANDRYFKQVNRGVLDVVGKLDEVVTAMRRVEKESREIWNESSGSDDLRDVTETDQSAKGPLRGRDAAESVVETDTDVQTDSPVGSRG